MGCDSLITWLISARRGKAVGCRERRKQVVVSERSELGAWGGGTGGEKQTLAGSPVFTAQSGSARWRRKDAHLSIIHSAV